MVRSRPLPDNHPDGDMPAGRGVCTNIAIRAYRKLGIDHQKEVREDVKGQFREISSKPGSQTKPDANIDNRRTPNPDGFFFTIRNGASHCRHGAGLQTRLPITGMAPDYKPGDIVCRRLSNGATHIGIVVDRQTLISKRDKIMLSDWVRQLQAACSNTK